MSAVDEYTTGQQLAIGGSGAAAIGAFLPWVKVSILGQTASQNGIDGDGTITLALALVAAGVIVVRNWEKVDKAAVLVAGLVTAGIGVMYIMDPASGTSASGTMMESAFSPGIGLYLTALGGIGMLAGAGMDLAD